MSIPRKRIHVNQHIIRANRKNGTEDPPIGIEYPGGLKVYANDVEIDGPSRLIYSPDKPLKCGARLWLETTAPIKFTAKGAKPFRLAHSRVSASATAGKCRK